MMKCHDWQVSSLTGDMIWTYKSGSLLYFPVASFRLWLQRMLPAQDDPTQNPRGLRLIFDWSAVAVLFIYSLHGKINVWFCVRGMKQKHYSVAAIFSTSSSALHACLHNNWMRAVRCHTIACEWGLKLSCVLSKHILSLSHITERCKH